jgi:hypothetical protein
MPGMDEFLDGTARTETEAEETIETGEETTTQVAAETTETLPTAKEKALEAELARIRQKNRDQELALLAKQEEEKPYLGEEYEKRFLDTETKFQRELVNQKLDLSESFARDKYADFDEKMETFKVLVNENPALYAQMVQQPNPADFAYKTALNQQKLQEMGNPLEYEKKLEEKIRAKLKAEIETEAAKREDLPGTLATTRGIAGTHAATWQGPPSLDDVLM